MKPAIDHVLRTAAAQLLMQIAPQVSDEHARTTTAMIAAMLGTAADEFERAADVAHAENQDFRALFRAAAGRIDDPDLAQRLREAGAGADASLRVSALNRANDALRRLLIELQAHVEELPGEQARGLEAQIWAALRRSAEGRLHPFVPAG